MNLEGRYFRPFFNCGEQPPEVKQEDESINCIFIARRKLNPLFLETVSALFVPIILRLVSLFSGDERAFFADGAGDIPSPFEGGLVQLKSVPTMGTDVVGSGHEPPFEKS